MAPDQSAQLGELPGRNEDYRHIGDAITAVRGLHPSKDEVRALRTHIDTVLAEAGARPRPTFRVLSPGKPGYDLEVGTIVAQQETTEEFFAFLDRRSAADAHDAGPR